MTTGEFVSNMRIKYPYISDDDMERIVNKAKMFYYRLRYPFKIELSEEDAPINSFCAEVWIKSACDEIIERLGFSSATGYTENSIRWSFDNCQLSNRLCSLIVPIAGKI